MSITNNGGVLFEFYRGDDVSYRVEIADDNENAIDITGWKFGSTLKLQSTDTDSEASIVLDFGTLSGTDAEAGFFMLAMSNAQTAPLEPALYYFDIQAEVNGAINTVIAGKVRVLADVTQRVQG